MRIYDPVGCFHCAGSGYRGRIGIYDVIEINKVVADIMPKNPSEAEIKEAISSYTPSSMLLDSTYKLHKGLTSLAEIMRVVDFDS